MILRPFDWQPRTRVIFGLGSFSELPELCRGLGIRRPLLVCDPGIQRVGLAERALSLIPEGILFTDFGENPDSGMVERGRAVAEAAGVDGIIGLGGGSSLDCAKGINFVLTGGGRMEDYWGYGKAKAGMLPMVGIPTTTGTGSEAQSYALISHDETHAKMACGDPQAAFRVAVLDPELTLSQPRSVLALAGMDAITHAVETAGSIARNALSLTFSKQAWELLSEAFAKAFVHAEVEVLAQMQLGAHFAGVAIENSMLGAAHACANPLTQIYGTPHGLAVGLMLPHVMRWNGEQHYAELGCSVLSRVEELRGAADIPARLQEIGVRREDLTRLAELAAGQWTGRFNPRAFDLRGALEIYECAW